MIKTREQVNKLSASIDDFLKKLYSSDIGGSSNGIENSFEDFAKENFSDLYSYIKQNSVSLSNREAVEEILSNYRDSFKNYEEIKLTLAVEPDEKFLKKILVWFSTNIPDTANYILDIEKKKSILGGLLISFRGTYADFSLEKKIDTYFETHSLDYALE